MNPQFSQPKGAVSKETNKDSIARKFGCKKSEVLYAKTGAGLTGYKVIYDKVSQRSYALPSNLPAGATITSLTDGVLVHSAGTVDLGALAVLRGEFVTLAENFTSGFTIRVKNEVVSDGTYLYRWAGSLPKTVAAGATVANTGGESASSWVLSDQLWNQLKDIDGAVNHPELQMARWRDQGDIRGWNGDINAAIVSNRIMGKTTKIPAGTKVTGQITVYDYTHIQGEGVDCSILKPSAGLSGYLVISDQANSLWGTQSLNGVRGVIIEDLTLDGDKINSPGASGIGIYGWNTCLKGVKIINFAGNGLRTEWADSGNASGGMEGTFSDLIIDKSGEHGWQFAGPHDSVVKNVIIISSSQKTSGAYDGLYLERGNARWSGVHVWTSADDNRSRYAVHIAREAQGNEFSLSHFEGANKNVLIDGNNTTLDSTCKVYYPWNQDNVIVNGSNVRLECYIGEEYKGIGLPLATGVTFGGTYGGPSGCIVDCIVNGCEAGAFYFGASSGYNKVRVIGYSQSTTTIGFGGSPAPTDTVDIEISGGKRTVFKQQMVLPNISIGEIAATGSSQTDAAAVDYTFNIRQITSGASGAGIKLPNTAQAGTGFKLTVVNTTGVEIKVYPNDGNNILGLGLNNPLALSGLQAAEFIVKDGSLGTWLCLKGA
ncbi:hypothetical protein DRX00_12420 [Salmonella enterica subsp. enterica serovar Gatuni]|nr:hypothetical protein [Salmonella enterica subsp. enterica serovar Gatuni]